MKSKKLSLLLSKLPEDKKEAFAAEMKNVDADAYEAIVEKYGIVLTDDEKAFLTSNTPLGIGDAEMADVVGGKIPCDPIYTEPDPTQETC